VSPWTYAHTSDQASLGVGPNIMRTVIFTLRFNDYPVVKR